MKLQQLRFFEAVCHSGLNVTAAAKKLFTSQPGISKQVRLLEDELGIQLFERHGRSLVAITPAGCEVLQRVEKILEEVENIKSLNNEFTVSNNNHYKACVTPQ